MLKNYLLISCTVFLSFLVLLFAANTPVHAIKTSEKGILFIEAYEKINGVINPYQGTLWACDQESPYRCYSIETKENGKGKIDLSESSYRIEPLAVNPPIIEPLIDQINTTLPNYLSEKSEIYTGFLPNQMCTCSWYIEPLNFNLSIHEHIRATATKVVECYEIPPLEDPIELPF